MTMSVGGRTSWRESQNSCDSDSWWSSPSLADMKHGIRGFRDKPRKQRLITSAKNQSRPRWLGEKWPWPPHPVRKINALNWESVTHNNLMGGWCHEVIPLIMWNGRVINGCPIARKVCRSVGTEKNVHLFPPVTLIRNQIVYSMLILTVYFERVLCTWKYDSSYPIFYFCVFLHTKMYKPFQPVNESAWNRLAKQHLVERI